VNIWILLYGLGRSLMVSIAKAERIRSEHLRESRTTQQVEGGKDEEASQ
jgi:hypothetical protein